MGAQRNGNGEIVLSLVVSLGSGQGQGVDSSRPVVTEDHAAGEARQTTDNAGSGSQQATDSTKNRGWSSEARLDQLVRELINAPPAKPPQDNRLSFQPAWTHVVITGEKRVTRLEDGSSSNVFENGDADNFPIARHQNSRLPRRLVPGPYRSRNARGSSGKVRHQYSVPITKRSVKTYPRRLRHIPRIKRSGKIIKNQDADDLLDREMGVILGGLVNVVEKKLMKDPRQEEIIQEPLVMQKILQKHPMEHRVFQRPSFAQKIIQRPPMVRKILQRPPVVQKVLQRPSMLQNIQRPPMVRKVIQRPPVVQKILQRPSVAQQILQRPSMLQNIQRPPMVRKVIQRPPVVQKIIQRPPVVQTILQRPYMLQDIQRPPMVRKVIQRPPVVQKIIQRPPVVQTIIQRPSVLQNIQRPSMMQTIIQRRPTMQNIIKTPTVRQRTRVIHKPVVVPPRQLVSWTRYGKVSLVPLGRYQRVSRLVRCQPHRKHKRGKTESHSMEGLVALPANAPAPPLQGPHPAPKPPENKKMGLKGAASWQGNMAWIAVHVLASVLLTRLLLP